ALLVVRNAIAVTVALLPVRHAVVVAIALCPLRPRLAVLRLGLGRGDRYRDVLRRGLVGLRVVGRLRIVVGLRVVAGLAEQAVEQSGAGPQGRLTVVTSVGSVAPAG